MQGEWGGTRKESWKSRANWRACFFRAPLTAPSEGLCYFLFPPPPPLSLSHITSLQEEERRGAERGGKRLVSTVMADERERGRFCTDAHLFSLCLLPPPFVPVLSLSNSMSSHTFISSQTSLSLCSHQTSFSPYRSSHYLHKTSIHPSCETAHVGRKHYTWGLVFDKFHPSFEALWGGVVGINPGTSFYQNTNLWKWLLCSINTF